MNNKIYFGADLGMGAFKGWGPKGGAQVLSLVSSNGAQRLEDSFVSSSKRVRPIEVSSEYGSYFVGDNAHDYGVPIQNMAFDRLAGTSEIRSIFYAGLHQYQKQHGVFDRPLSLMVGLPFQMLMGSMSKEYKAAVKKWMVGAHEFNADGVHYKVEVADAVLKPQAMGILFDHTYDENGILDPGKANLWVEETAGLSFGRKTIEFMLTRDNDDVDRFTGGIDMGVTRLLEGINRQYEMKLGMERPYTLGELDMKLRNRKIDKEVMKRAMEDWIQQISGAIDERWGQYYRRFSAVIVVGGGAELLRPHIHTLLRGNVIVPDNAVEAISRGMYKMALKYASKRA